MREQLAHLRMTRIPRDPRIRRRKGEAGYVIVTAALSVFLLFGLIGLAIDVGQLRLAQQKLQSAADAAAIAGGEEILFPDVSTAAYAAAAANGGPGGSSATQLGACPISSGTTGVCVSHPPVDGPHTGDTNYVEVMVAQSQSTFFMGVIGANTVWLSARAVASAGSPNCIWALGTGGLGLFAANIQSQCGAVDAGVLSEDDGCLIAPSIGVVGSVSDHRGCNTRVSKLNANQVIDPFGCSGGMCVPAPSFAVPASASNCTPFSSVVTPPSSSIPAGAYSGTGGGPVTINAATGSVTFQGGTYVFCNGLYIGGGGAGDDNVNVTFNAGTYVMYGGGFQMHGTYNGHVSGNGVLIYNTGTGTGGWAPYGSVGTSFAGGNSLTGQPPYGLLFFQDRSNPSAANFNANFTFQTCNAGNTNPFLQGAYYFPDAQVNFNFDFGCGAQYSILVAQSVDWNFAFTFNDNYSSLPDGVSPIKNTGALAE